VLVAVLAVGAAGYLAALWKLRDHLALTAFTAMLRRRRNPQPTGDLPAANDTKPVPMS
jgi:hypothetical protein